MPAAAKNTLAADVASPAPAINETPIHLDVVDALRTRIIEDCRLPHGGCAPSDSQLAALVTAYNGVVDGDQDGPQPIQATGTDARESIYSVRSAIAETDLPADMSSSDAIRELWRRLGGARLTPRR